jgi:NAD(P)-dependent dehydrogenase (short-subunit alcohol dehydrogenase family)
MSNIDPPKDPGSRFATRVAEGGSAAIVIGATGGIGSALVAALRADGRFDRVLGYSREGDRPLDLTSETSVAEAARELAATGLGPRLLLVASGMLHDANCRPEKSWLELEPASLARLFAVNAIGPALVMKHFLPLLPRRGRTVFAALSARVGSIGDNRLGGWYGYRASKAALNQLLHTAAIELRRTRPEAICVALHPGTVETRLSAPFTKKELEVQAPAVAARRLLAAVDRLTPADSGGFFDHRGDRVPW